MEIFKPIEGFEGLYEISNYGNVKSLISNIIRKNNVDKDGYYVITLNKDKKVYGKKIHRLVAKAFLPNPDNLPQVNHKDENPKNNFVWINEDGSVDYEKSNLEWCDAHYNNTYNGRHLKVAAKQRGKQVSEETRRKLSDINKGNKNMLGKHHSEETKAKLRNHPNMSKPVVALDKEGNVVHRFSSTAEAQRNGFSSSGVCNCCNNRPHYKTYKGLRWMWEIDYLRMIKEVS